MYYLKMKTAIKADLKSKIFSISENSTRLKEKEISSINFKFYQNIFIILISVSTFLIFSEVPKELEDICEAYNSRKSCMVW